ncbi:hypothetical protein [Nonomuraea sp. NPDC003804]|uniref:hypothetical protein n=1 Tax=Nonomuraea sp. NPDC003804 TaxID=3154547 RepID=UPI0033B989A0
MTVTQQPVRPAAVPTRRALVVVLSVVGGAVLSMIWSATFVDKVIGGTVATTLLGGDPQDFAFTGTAAGMIFAFVTGVAGTFTACNVAVFGALAPMFGEGEGVRGRMVSALRPLGWLVVGMVVVSATYGVIAALVGDGMPQASTAPSGPGLSPRSVQSMVAFGLIGLVMIYLGLAALNVVRDPLRRISARFPHARVLLMGALIGGFLVGRPYGLFRQLFRDTAASHDPFYGALAFVLQSAGNILLVAVLFLALAGFAGGRLHRWFTAKPGRAAVVAGSALLVVGVFTLLYWDVRLLARRELIWYPMAPWS